MPQAETVALPKRIPMVLQPENRDETTDKDSRLINGYVEKDKNTGEYRLYKRPGLLEYASVGAAAGLGVYNWLGDIYSVFGNRLYKNGVAVSGTVDTTGGLYTFSTSKGVTPRLQLSNGVGAYNYDSGGGLVAIAGANFPTPRVKGWAYLDSTTYVMDSDAGIHGCDSLNEPGDWTDVTNLIEAQIEPDDGVALAKQLVYVIALKQWSTEVFYDALNPTGSPLGPVQGAKVRFGCANADSVQEIDDALIWLAINRSSTAQVVMLDGLKATVVSTKPIERLLGEADFSDVSSFAFKYEGHSFYGITLRCGNLTLVYDMTEDLWAQWTDHNGDYFPCVATTFITATGQRILQHETNGKLYLFDSSYTSDDGEIITTDLYTPNFDAGTGRRKQLNVLSFVGDQTEGSVLQVRCNDNDYNENTWSSFRQVDMSQRKPNITNCGSFIRRAYHIRHQSNTRLRLAALEVQIDLGTL